MDYVQDIVNRVNIDFFYINCVYTSRCKC